VSPASDAEDRSAAFERSVLPLAERLFRIALAIVDDPGEAEDAVQETMLSAWRHWASLRDPDSLPAWLTRICVNHCIRRRRLRGRLIFWAPERWSATAGAEPPGLDGRLLATHRAFQSLSPSQRAMVSLHICDGVSVNECAAFLGCRPGTARSHLGRALAKLKGGLSHA
jgi:RNA polymerase sigma-70 factor (ECF subfamily)